MPTDGHSGFLKTGGSHIGADRLCWCWGKAPCPVPSAGRADCLPRGKPFVFSARRHAPGFSRQPGPKGTGGNEGKRVPGGHNRRRRLATRSSCKQQAERTAVRAAPIVCPEESPQCARRRKPLPRRGMTRRLRRGKRACSPMGRSIASVGDPKGVQGGT